MIYVLATNNPGKAKEIKPPFEEAGLEIITLAELGLFFEAGEDGDTFYANALQKAQETAAYIKAHATSITINCDELAVIADDSGLVIDALGGAPGVHSALFMGRDTPYLTRCNAIISKLDKQRTARFVCTLVCLFADNTVITAEGSVEGSITHKPHGSGGFGYDPIFYYPPLGKTMAELTKDEKNLVSHRGKAIRHLIQALT